MSHPKPTVFFSHSSRDKVPLTRLKELFVAKTGGAIDVFQSSDGQSIPLGRNWVKRVEAGLEDAKLMLCFITANSLESDWLYFESGYAYAREIRVVPIGFLGVDLNALRPPLSLLQGFNINSSDGLDNIIAVANDEFDMSHSQRFSEDEFKAVMALAPPEARPFFGNHTALVEEVSLYSRELKSQDVSVLCGIALEFLTERKIQFYQKQENSPIIFHGGRIHIHGVRVKDESVARVDVDLDPIILNQTLPAMVDLIRILRGRRDLNSLTVAIEFSVGVFGPQKQQKISSRLFGVGVSLGGESKYIYEGVEFSINHRQMDEQGGPWIHATIRGDTFPTNTLVNLVDLLFERSVLFFPTVAR